MEHIKSHIGPNNVSLNIRESKYYERSMDGSVEKKPVHCENLVETFRQLKGSSRPGFVKADPVVAPQSKPQKSHGGVKQEETKIMRPSDPIVFAYMQVIDPLVSLYTDIDDKVDKFKEDMVKNLTNFNNMYKKLALNKQYKVEEIVEAVWAHDKTLVERVPMLLYMTRLVNKSFCIYTQEGEEPVLLECGQACKILRYCRDLNIYQIEKEDTDYIKIQDALVKERIKTYIKDGLLSKINSLSVKDLRDISERLNLPLHKTEDGKKKLLLKPELKDNIVKKIETHII